MSRSASFTALRQGFYKLVEAIGDKYSRGCPVTGSKLQSGDNWCRAGQMEESSHTPFAHRELDEHQLSNGRHLFASPVVLLCFRGESSPTNQAVRGNGPAFGD